MNSKIVSVLHLGRQNYRRALSVQTHLVGTVQSNIEAGRQSGNTLVVVEHCPVYTTGIRTREYSQAEEERLVQLGAEFVRTNRGGLITFHGPGQLVCYPILNLRDFAPETARRKALLGMKWYVHSLEQTVIELLARLGVEGVRSPHTGVWVGSNKICAMGVHSNNLVTSHGLALNCNTDMAWFGHIVPCGITEVGTGVTSLSKELNRDVTIEEVTDQLVHQFRQTFSCETRVCDSEERTQILSSCP